MVARWLFVRRLWIVLYNIGKSCNMITHFYNRWLPRFNVIFNILCRIYASLDSFCRSKCVKLQTHLRFDIFKTITCFINTCLINIKRSFNKLCFWIIPHIFSHELILNWLERVPSPLINFHLLEYFLSWLQQFAFFVKIIWIVEYIGTVEPIKIHFLLAQANLLFEFIINSVI